MTWLSNALHDAAGSYADGFGFVVVVVAVLFAVSSMMYAAVALPGSLQ